MGKFPLLAWSMLLVSKGSATSAGGFDLNEAAESVFAQSFSVWL